MRGGTAHILDITNTYNFRNAPKSAYVHQLMPLATHSLLRLRTWRATTYILEITRAHCSIYKRVKSMRARALSIFKRDENESATAARCKMHISGCFFTHTMYFIVRAKKKGFIFSFLNYNNPYLQSSKVVLNVYVWDKIFSYNFVQISIRNRIWKLIQINPASIVSKFQNEFSSSKYYIILHYHTHKLAQKTKENKINIYSNLFQLCRKKNHLIPKIVLIKSI